MQHESCLSKIINHLIRVPRLYRWRETGAETLAFLYISHVNLLSQFKSVGRCSSRHQTETLLLRKKHQTKKLTTEKKFAKKWKKVKTLKMKSLE